MNQSENWKSFPGSEMMESTANLWFSAARDWQEMALSLSDLVLSENHFQAQMWIWKAFVPSWPAGEVSGAGANGSAPLLETFLRVMGQGRMSRELSTLFWNNKPAVPMDAPGGWTDFYERAVKPLLRMPAVGLTRVFQEKIAQLVDKFHSYQRTLSQFQMLLRGPIDKAFADMGKEKEGKDAGRLTADDDYKDWIKGLEGHYMKLFRSEDYRASLSRLLDETAAFRISANGVLTDFLQFLPIPTNKEMDDLYKEIYTIKKTVRESAKMIRNLQGSLAGRAVASTNANVYEGDRR